jgi:tetratricopeptide (TPR) repeat protein
LLKDAESQLAGAYDRAGQFRKSEPLHRAALEKALKRHGTDHPLTANVMAVLGANLLRQGKHDQAEAILRRCLKVREKILPDEWRTFNTRSALGAALLGQGKRSEAEPFLLQGYRGMKQREASIPVAARFRLVDALERLVRLYEATGNKDEAARWRKELQAARTSGKGPGR